MRERIYLFDTTLRDGAQTTGVDFSPASRAEAISMIAPVGSLVATAMIAESEGPAPSWNAAPPRAR